MSSIQQQQQRQHASGDVNDVLDTAFASFAEGSANDSEQHHRNNNSNSGQDAQVAADPPRSSQSPNSSLLSDATTEGEQTAGHDTSYQSTLPGASAFSSAVKGGQPHQQHHGSTSTSQSPPRTLFRDEEDEDERDAMQQQQEEGEAPRSRFVFSSECCDATAPVAPHVSAAAASALVPLMEHFPEGPVDASHKGALWVRVQNLDAHTTAKSLYDMFFPYGCSGALACLVNLDLHAAAATVGAVGSGATTSPTLAPPASSSSCGFTVLGDVHNLSTGSVASSAASAQQHAGAVRRVLGYVVFHNEVMAQLAVDKMHNFIPCRQSHALDVAQCAASEVAVLREGELLSAPTGHSDEPTNNTTTTTALLAAHVAQTTRRVRTCELRAESTSQHHGARSTAGVLDRSVDSVHSATSSSHGRLLFAGQQQQHHHHHHHAARGGSSPPSGSSSVASSTDQPTLPMLLAMPSTSPQHVAHYILQQGNAKQTATDVCALTSDALVGGAPSPCAWAPHQLALLRKAADSLAAVMDGWPQRKELQHHVVRGLLCQILEAGTPDRCREGAGTLLGFLFLTQFITGDPNELAAKLLKGQLCNAAHVCAICHVVDATSSMVFPVSNAQFYAALADTTATHPDVAIRQTCARKLQERFERKQQEQHHQPHHHQLQQRVAGASTAGNNSPLSPNAPPFVVRSTSPLQQQHHQQQQPLRGGSPFGHPSNRLVVSQFDNSAFDQHPQLRSAGLSDTTGLFPTNATGASGGAFGGGVSPSSASASSRGNSPVSPLSQAVLLANPAATAAMGLGGSFPHALGRHGSGHGASLLDQHQQQQQQHQSAMSPMSKKRAEEARSRTIYLSRLSPTAPKVRLMQFLQSCGEVTKIRVCVDQGYATLYGFLEMQTVQGARNVLMKDREDFFGFAVRFQSARSPIQDVDPTDAIEAPNGMVMRPCQYGAGVSDNEPVSEGAAFRNQGTQQGPR